MPDSPGNPSSAGNGAPLGSAPRPDALSVLWRKKLIVIVTFVVCVGVTAILSTSVLPKVYAAKATLWVTQERQQTNFDTVQAGQVLARTYANLIESENVAAVAATRLPGGLTAGDVKSRMSFEAVPETQLLEITAAGDSAEEAQTFANTYAQSAVAYARTDLADQGGSSISVANLATLPGQPAQPKPTLYTLVGGLLGIALGCALAYLAAVLDRRVRSPEELAELLGVPALAHIAIAKGRRAVKLNEEAYRVLRTNLEFVRPGKPLRRVTIVSPSEGEGKSSTVLNLGRAMAEAGDRVLLVEGDMRRPALQRQLNPEQPEPLSPGLSNLLAGSSSVADVLYRTDDPGITLVPAGPMPPAPSALLDTDRGQKVLGWLAEETDVMVIDTPPLSVGADASLLAAEADEVLMVVDLRRSSRKAILAALTQLQLIKAPLAGTILNRVKDPGDSAYGYNYYYADVDSEGSTRRWPFGRKNKRPARPAVTPPPDRSPADLEAARANGEGAAGSASRAGEEAGRHSDRS